MAALGLAAPASAAPAPPAEPLRSFTTTTLTFTVEVGPPADRRTCRIVGDLRVPEGVRPGAPAPGAVLTTNGFGGSKDGTGPNGNGSYAARFAEQGYVTVSYSGLGFGGSSCNIYVDDPAYDGQAGSQLVSFLGGAKGIAARDGVPSTSPASCGSTRAGRTGSRTRTTRANDLGYSLSPNNAGNAGTSVTNDVPGIWKSAWQGLFFGLGVAAPVTNPENKASTCGGYVPWICQAVAEQATLGYPSAETVARTRDVSVVSYVGKVKVPVLLSQGQRDSLFTLNEAAATYEQLRKQGNTVRMVWQSWGHTASDPVPGELDTGTLEPRSAVLTDTYQGRIITDWMAHWLKDAKTDLGPAVRYFRDWAYTPPADPSDRAAALLATQQAYATSGQFPVTDATRLSLSGGNALVPSGAPVSPGSASFVSTGATPATNTGEVIIDSAAAPSVDAPGTFAAWTGAPLTAPLHVAGIPELSVRFDAPTLAATQTASPAGKLMVFAKLYDVAPDGTRTLVKDLVSAARIPDVRQRVRITLPGIVHRFDTGHRVQLVLAASDATYKGTGLAGTATVVDSPAAPNVLSLPVLSSRGAASSTPR